MLMFFSDMKQFTFYFLLPWLFILLALFSSSQKASFLRSTNWNRGKAGFRLSTENDGGTEAPKAHYTWLTNPSKYALLSGRNIVNMHVSRFLTSDLCSSCQ